MGTDYTVCIQARDVRDGAALLKILEEAGIRGSAPVEDEDYPDRWAVEVDGLREVELFNERLTSDTAPEGSFAADFDPDFELVCWVAFHDDHPQTREAVLALTRAVATRFTVRVTYNDDFMLAESTEPGGRLHVNDDLPYVSEGIDAEAAVRLTGLTKKNMGLP